MFCLAISLFLLIMLQLKSYQGPSTVASEQSVGNNIVDLTNEELMSSSDGNCKIMDSQLEKLRKKIDRCANNRDGNPIIICYEIKYAKLSRRFAKEIDTKLSSYCLEEAKNNGNPTGVYVGVELWPGEDVIKIHSSNEADQANNAFIEDYAEAKALSIGLAINSKWSIFLANCQPIVTTSKLIGTTSTTESTSPSTIKTTRKIIRNPNISCVADWKFVEAAEFFDGFLFNMLINASCGAACGREWKWQYKWNYAIRVGFLQKPAETEGPHEFKQLKESMANSSAGDEKILKAEYVMKMLEDSYARDLNETADYDYLDIPVEKHEENLTIGVEVRVHNCSDGAEFVSAARKRHFTNGKPTPWRNWSQDLTFLNYCCYDEEGICKKKSNNIWRITKYRYWPIDLDATIDKLKFGYVLPNKTLTREQQLAVKYKYGLSLAERPRFRNQNPYKANPSLPFTDGCFIAPPKLGVKPSEERKVNIKFYYDGDINWDKYNKGIMVQIRQSVIDCDCSEESYVPGKKGLMRGLKFFVPRIHAVVIGNETAMHRDPKSPDIIQTVKVGPRSEITKDWKTELILYDENEWKDDI